MEGRIASTEGRITAVVADENMSRKLLAYYRCFKTNFNYYFQELRKSPNYAAASFLDPSCSTVLDTYDDAIKFIKKHFCTQADNYKETLYDGENNDHISGEERFQHLPPVMRKEAIEEYLQSRGTPSATNFSPFENEVRVYKKFLRDMFVERSDGSPKIYHLDALKMWPVEPCLKDCNILKRAASILLAQQPCESDVERMFSSGGRTCTIERVAMAGETAGMLTTLRAWLKEDFRYEEDRRVEKRREKAARFASLIASQNGLMICNAEDSSIAEEEESESLMASLQQVSVFDKTTYDGPILLCPPEGIRGVQVGDKIAVYFEDVNDWSKGAVRDTHKGFVNIDNVEVQYDDGIWTHCISCDNYGPSKFWVLLSPL